MEAEASGALVTATRRRFVAILADTAEDLQEGIVEMGRGDLVVLAAIGANVNYGAQLVRL